MADPRDALGYPPPLNGTQFFRFHICFRRKAPLYDVGTPHPSGKQETVGAAPSTTVKLRSAAWKV